MIGIIFDGRGGIIDTGVPMELQSKFLNGDKTKYPFINCHPIFGLEICGYDFSTAFFPFIVFVVGSGG